MNTTALTDRAPDSTRRAIAEAFAALDITLDDAAHLLTLAILIRSGTIAPSRDLAPDALDRLRSPALPAWARMTPAGNLSINLDEAAFVEAEMIGGRRLVIGPRSGQR